MEHKSNSVLGLQHERLDKGFGSSAMLDTVF